MKVLSMKDFDLKFPKNTIGAFDAKTNLSRLLFEIDKTRKTFVIEKRGRPVAVLSPYSAERPCDTRLTVDFENFRGGQSKEKKKKSPLLPRELVNFGRRR